MITILKDEQFRVAVLKAINEANKEILIATYKMDCKGHLSTRHLNALVSALYRAAKRGVRVRCLLNMDSDHSTIGRINMRTKALLTEKGILVKTGPIGRTYHSKIIIIDEEVAFVGSHNLTESSLCRNFEVSIMIDPAGPVLSAQTQHIKTIIDLRQIYLYEWEKGR